MNFRLIDENNQNVEKYNLPDGGKNKANETKEIKIPN